MKRRSFTLSAEWIVPVAEPPIKNGTVVVKDGVIAQVLHRRPDNVDFELNGQTLLPRLVNAHTHLEFSDLNQPIGRRDIPITDWIPSVIGNRIHKGTEDKRLAIERGVKLSIQSGSCLLGEIATGREYAKSNRDVCITTFLECLGNDPDKIANTIQNAREFLSEANPVSRRGISPHAPYSVHPELFEQLLRLAIEFDAPVAMHLAETREEERWVREGTGPFEKLLADLGALRPEVQIAGRRFVDFLHPLSRCSSALIVHGNYLDAEALQLIAANQQTMHIVFCPRTHEYFGHDPYPLQEMLTMGINVAIGTDSLASNPDLSVWRELVHIRKSHPALSPNEILKLGTRNGAVALGFPSAGWIAKGCAADFLVQPIGGQDDPLDSLFESDEPTPLEI